MAKERPSGATASEMKRPPGRPTLFSTRPVAVSMMCKDPPSAATRCSPSGAKAAAPSIIMRISRPAGSTSPGTATPGGRTAFSISTFPVLDVPDPQVEIVALGEETSAVRREADRPAAAVQPVSGQLVDLLATWMSHRRTKLSRLDEARNRPSGETAMARTQ